MRYKKTFLYKFAYHLLWVLLAVFTFLVTLIFLNSYEDAEFSAVRALSVVFLLICFYTLMRLSKSRNLKIISIVYIILIGLLIISTRTHLAATWYSRFR